MWRSVAAAALVIGLVLPARAQYPGEARLVEAKQLAGAVLRALERCVHGKGAGASCTLGEVAAMAGLNPATGMSPNGRWIVTSRTMLSLTSGGGRAGTVAITGVPGRDTAGLAVALHVTPAGNVMRCDMRSGVPPGPGSGDPC